MNPKHGLNMKSLDVKIEKANAILKYQRLQKLTTLFRFMEIIIFLVMISKFLSQLPAAVKVSGDFFRGTSFTVLNPKFVFVIGNVIIMILYLKSRDVENSGGNGKADLCYEYVKNCDRVVNCTSVISTETKICRSQSENRTKVKCEGNQIHRELRRSVTEVGRSDKFCHGNGDTTVMTMSSVKDDLSSDDLCYEYVKNCVVNRTSVNTTNKRKICRSRSDNRIKVKCDGNQIHRELRRSVTEIGRSEKFGHGDGDTAAMEKSLLKDELSSDDFRQTVEAYISRQQKMLRDEEFSPMEYICS